MSHVEVSIITPFKNAAPFLSDCIQSVQSQSLKNWEWIVINDFSDDNSLEIFQKAAQNDSRIKVFQNEGKGIISALQTALKNASGKYVSRMDADDKMPPFRLEKMVDFLKNQSSKTIVTGWVEYFSENEISNGYKSYQNWLNKIAKEVRFWQNIYRECVVASPNWIMRTEELREIGGFEKLEYPEDYDLVFRWYQAGFQIKTIPETTLLWREHPARTSRNSDNYSQEKFFQLKVKRFLELDYKKADLVLWGTGRKGKFTAQILNENKIDFHWMEIIPERIGEEIYGHKILNYKDLEEFPNAQLLVAVYPAQAEREKLEAYLSELNFTLGNNFYYL